MKTKIVFASATALGLLMATGAYAGNNTTQIIMNGSNNTGQVTQSGNYNTAGTNNYANNAEKMRQDGNYNSLSISQTGNHNIIAQGNSDAEGSTPTTGVRQTGAHNNATLTQTGGNSYYGGHVIVVEQNAATGATANTNVLRLTQTDSTSDDAGNLASVISQTNTGTGLSAADVNTMNVTQTVDAKWALTHRSYQAGNQARRLSQSGVGNTANLTQHGLGNIVRYLTQSGASNTANVDFEGNFNGSNVNTASSNFYDYATGNRIVTFATPATMAAGAEQGKILQTGTNSLNMTVTGDSNLYGTAQYGQNSLTVNVTGNSNQVGATQGTGLVSTSGGVGIVNVTGNSNVLGLRQVGGDGDQAYVTVYGSNNNNTGSDVFTTGGTLTTVLGGPVNIGAGNVTDGLGHSLIAGLIEQDGGGSNYVKLDVGLPTGDSDSNLFATLQVGHNNSITGSISGGGSNQAAVAQLGNYNTANFTQIGASNNLGISQ